MEKLNLGSTMIYCYIFELKSIQSYIFNSSLLKDVITCSERLSSLIDEPSELLPENTSYLHHILTRLSITHNLDIPDAELPTQNSVYIARANGGALVMLSTEKDVLVRFRGLWNLTVSQLFPGVQSVDILHEGNNITPALLINEGNRKLHGLRNLVKPMLPRPTAATECFSHTSETAVVPEYQLYDSKHDVDAAAYINRIHKLNSRNALCQKFTPSQNERFKFATTEQDIINNNAQGSSDIALVHIDGNALGNIANEVRTALEKENDIRLYCQKFRAFSKTISNSTIQAARNSVEELQKHTGTDIPLRPIVCGGDDVTLLIGAELAFDFTQQFCLQFEKLTAQNIKKLNKHLFNQTLTVKKLTASAGILIQKPSQPFSTGINLVEQLTAQAKDMAKILDPKIRYAVNTPDIDCKPSTMSYFKISTVYNANLADLWQASYDIPWEVAGSTLHTAADAFYLSLAEPAVQKVIDQTDGVYVLAKVRAVAEQLGTGILHKHLNTAKLRRLLTEISLGRFAHAETLVNQTMNKKGVSNLALYDAFKTLYQSNDTSSHFWLSPAISPDNPDKYSVIQDLIQLSKWAKVGTKPIDSASEEHHAA